MLLLNVFSLELKFILEINRQFQTEFELLLPVATDHVKAG